MLASDTFDFSPASSLFKHLDGQSVKNNWYVGIYFIATFGECPYSDLSRDPSDFLLRYK